MDLRNYVRESLKQRATGNDVVLAEAKSVEAWWDRLPGKRRKKVVDILGMSKGKDSNQYTKLDADEQAEISAYYKKHKGKVEGFEGFEGEFLEEIDVRFVEDIGEWIDALAVLDKEMLRFAAVVRSNGKGKANLDAIRKHFKGMRSESIQLLRLASKNEGFEDDGEPLDETFEVEIPIDRYSDKDIVKMIERIQLALKMGAKSDKKNEAWFKRGMEGFKGNLRFFKSELAKRKKKGEDVEDDSEPLDEANTNFDLYRAALAAGDRFIKALKAQFGAKYQYHMGFNEKYDAKAQAAFNAKVKADKAWLAEMQRTRS